MELFRQKLIAMLNYLDAVCVKEGLRYYAIGGTFLGAIRHGGFIPWDDDIDVCMPRQDYNRLAEIVNSQKGQYVIETPYSKANDFCYSITKMYDTSTTLVEGCKYMTKRGIYIDVFPLDGIGNDAKEINRNYLKIDLMNAILASRTSVVRNSRDGWKNAFIKIIGSLPAWIIDDKKLLCKMDDECCRFDYELYNYVGVLLTQYRKKYIMEKSLFAETERYKFENTTIIGVKDYDKYLSTLFGNWRELPPKEKQVAGHDYVYLDLNKSYLE